MFKKKSAISRGSSSAPSPNDKTVGPLGELYQEPYHIPPNEVLDFPMYEKVLVRDDSDIFKADEGSAYLIYSTIYKVGTEEEAKKCIESKEKPQYCKVIINEANLPQVGKPFRIMCFSFNDVLCYAPFTTKEVTHVFEYEGNIFFGISEKPHYFVLEPYGVN